MAPRSRKRAKNLTTTSTSKNVVLKAFIGMPIDIIFEIFGYLDPLDILHLARTTKVLRAILMSRSSLSLWKRVRHAYYQMPDGPVGMSEPRYASLAFEGTCDGCEFSDTYGPDLSEPQYASLTFEGTCDGWEIPDTYGPGLPEPQYASKAREGTCDGWGFPDTYGPGFGRVHTFWNAQLKCCSRCESTFLANKSNLKLRDFDLFKALPFRLATHIEQRTKSGYDSCYSMKQVLIWSQEYASLEGSSAGEWLSQVMEKIALTEKHTESFHSWTHYRDSEKSAEHSRRIEAIEKALLIKLEELGWGEEMSKMNSWQRHDLYRFLLDYECGSFSQVWSSNGPAILKELKAIKNARLKKEREMLLASRYFDLREIYDEYISGLPADALIPTVADVALTPSVDAIIKDERTDIDTRKTFGDINLMQTLPSIFSDWKIRLDDELVRMVKMEFSETFTKDQLLLATTVFYCSACCIDLFYPQVLVHRCPVPFREIVVNCLECPAWNSSGNIKFDKNVHQAAIDIIDILGLDPKTVTAEDMTVKNSVLQCLDCRTTRRGRMTMIWSRAIEHSREQHNCLPSKTSWKIPGHVGQLTLQARLAQALAASDCVDSDSIRPRFMCGICRLKDTLVGLNKHLLSAHGIENPDERDILHHPDALQAPLQCVLPEFD